MAKKIIAPEEMVNRKVETTDTISTDGYGIFTILEHNKKFQITIGMKIISKETFKSIKDAKKYIDSKPWEIILNLAALVSDTMINMKQTETENLNKSK